MIRYALAACAAVAAVAVAAAPAPESAERWYAEGASALARALALEPQRGAAKNVILFIGDGMGITTVTAARIFDGQLRGESGEENTLAFEQLPHVALAKTYNTNQQTPDSAGAMTAIMTGVKTKAGLIGVNQRARRGDCASAQGNELQTFLEQAELLGLATGVVTTSAVTHATPAATYAHSPERNWESDAQLPAAASAAGCRDIARQLIEFAHGDGLDVVLGGGRGKFLPATLADPEDASQSGERRDGRNLTDEWLARGGNAVYVWNKRQFVAADVEQTDRLLGLFNHSHMSFEHDRRNDQGGEPSLSEMTEKALKILQKNPQGFFLMVESGRIDHAHHGNNAYRALDETREFANAVRTALALTDSKETLIIVTADHSHVLTMAGYPWRGNPILGKVVGSGDDRETADQEPARARDGRPYTTLGYANGPGGAVAGTEGQRRDVYTVDTTNPNYRQYAGVPLLDETHGGEDVAIFAGGPWAHLFHQTHEQNYIYHVMRYAGIEQRQRSWWQRLFDD
jgi:alkaline phosphatase